MLGIILVSVLGFMVIRSKRGPEYAWEYNKDEMTEAMLGDSPKTVEPITMNQPVQDVPPALDLGPPTKEVPEDMTVSDLYD